MKGEPQRLRVFLELCARHLVAGEARMEFTLQVRGTLGLGKNDKDGAFFMLETLNASEDINGTLF